MAESKRIYNSETIVPASMWLKPIVKHDKQPQKKDRRHKGRVRVTFSEEMIVELIERIKVL